MRAESDTASISCFLTLRVVSEQTWMRRVGPSSSGGWEESLRIWRGVFGVTTESSKLVLRHIPGMRELTNNSGKLENHVLLGRGAEGCKSVTLPSPGHKGEEGYRAEKCGLSGLSATLGGCFPSSAVSPELPRPVSCGADRVSRQASWLLLLSAGGAGGCNLCQATWRFGLDWSVSAPDTQWALLDTMGTPPAPTSRNIPAELLFKKANVWAGALCWSWVTI